MEQFMHIDAKVLDFATNPTTFVYVQPHFPHTFIGVMPCDASGVFDAATAGTATVTAETYNCPGVQQDVLSGVIDMTLPGDASVAGNLRAVHVAVTGLVGATHYRVSVTQNLS